MAVQIAGLLLSFAVGVWAPLPSNPPAPSPPKATTEPKTDAGHDQDQAADNKRPAENSLTRVELLKTPVVQIEPSEKAEKARDYTSSEWWLVYLTAALSVITGYLALFTGKLFRATARAGEDAKCVQRAYIQVNDLDEPIELGEDGSFFGSFRIRNYGNTPARITAISVASFVLHSRADLPPEPPYGSEFEIHVLVAPQDHFVHQRRLEYSANVVEAADTLQSINVMTLTLYIVGYVDYTDNFGVNHRNGFARSYFPPRPQGSGKSYLTFITNQGYNYDTERK